jgi:hypothetical protein
MDVLNSAATNSNFTADPDIVRLSNGRLLVTWCSENTWRRFEHLHTRTAALAKLAGIRLAPSRTPTARAARCS